MALGPRKPRVLGGRTWGGLGPQRSAARPQPQPKGEAHAPSSSTLAKPRSPVLLLSEEAGRSPSAPYSPSWGRGDAHSQAPQHHARDPTQRPAPRIPGRPHLPSRGRNGRGVRRAGGRCIPGGGGSARGRLPLPLSARPSLPLSLPPAAGTGHAEPLLWGPPSPRRRRIPYDARDRALRWWMSPSGSAWPRTRDEGRAPGAPPSGRR